MSRTTMLDDLVEKRICDALKDGHSYVAAARAGGISEATFHEWRRRGENADDRAYTPRYATFAKRVGEADQEAENRAVAVLRAAMSHPDQRLATDTAWKWLARRRPKDWAERKLEAEAPELTAEEADRLIAEAAKLASGQK